MTREQAKELLPIIQAFAEGKTIQVKGPDNRWYDYEGKNCKLKFDSRVQDYCIKPKYRPFKNAEECWKEMLKHQPFGWVKEKGDEPSYELLANVSENDEAPISFAVHGSVGMGIIDRPSIEFNEMFNTFTFADGTPFGIREC